MSARRYSCLSSIIAAAFLALGAVLPSAAQAANYYALPLGVSAGVSPVVIDPAVTIPTAGVPAIGYSAGVSTNTSLSLLYDYPSVSLSTATSALISGPGIATQTATLAPAGTYGGNNLGPSNALSPYNGSSFLGSSTSSNSGPYELNIVVRYAAALSAAPTGFTLNMPGSLSAFVPMALSSSLSGPPSIQTTTAIGLSTVSLRTNNDDPNSGTYNALDNQALTLKFTTVDFNHALICVNGMVWIVGFNGISGIQPGNIADASKGVDDSFFGDPVGPLVLEIVGGQGPYVTGSAATAPTGYAAAASTPNVFAGVMCGDHREVQSLTYNATLKGSFDSFLFAFNHPVTITQSAVATSLAMTTSGGLFFGTSTGTTIALGTASVLPSSAYVPTQISNPLSGSMELVPLGTGSFSGAGTPFNTGSVPPQINIVSKYTASSTTGAQTAGSGVGFYNDVFDVNTGQRLIISTGANFNPSTKATTFNTTNLTAGGAQPILVNAFRVETTPGSGTLVLQFSSAVSPSTMLSGPGGTSLSNYAVSGSLPINIQINTNFSDVPTSVLPQFIGTNTGNLLTDALANPNIDLGPGQVGAILSGNTPLYGSVNLSNAAVHRDNPNSLLQYLTPSSIVFDIGQYSHSDELDVTNGGPGCGYNPGDGCANGQYLSGASLQSIGTLPGLNLQLADPTFLNPVVVSQTISNIPAPMLPGPAGMVPVFNYISEMNMGSGTNNAQVTGIVLGTNLDVSAYLSSASGATLLAPLGSTNTALAADFTVSFTTALSGTINVPVTSVSLFPGAMGLTLASGIPVSSLCNQTVPPGQSGQNGPQWCWNAADYGPVTVTYTEQAGAPILAVPVCAGTGTSQLNTKGCVPPEMAKSVTQQPSPTIVSILQGSEAAQSSGTLPGLDNIPFFGNQVVVTDSTPWGLADASAANPDSNSGLLTQTVTGRLASQLEPDGTLVTSTSPGAINYGTATAAKYGIAWTGPVMRADVAFIGSNSLTSANATVSTVLAGSNLTFPNVNVTACSPDGNTDFQSLASLMSSINEQSVASVTGAPAYLNVYTSNGLSGAGVNGVSGVAAVLSDLPDNTGMCNPIGNVSFVQNGCCGTTPAPATIAYPVTIKTVAQGTASTTFASTGLSAASGAITTIKTQPSLQFLCPTNNPSDPNYVMPGVYSRGECPTWITDDMGGTFVTNLAVNSIPLGVQPFILVTILDNNVWQLGTYADPSLANYVPFRPDVVAGTSSGTGTTNLGGGIGSAGKTNVTIFQDLIGLAQLGSSANLSGGNSGPASSGTGWSLVGFPGNIARAASTTGFASQTFLMSNIQSQSNTFGPGEPFGLWFSAALSSAQALSGGVGLMSNTGLSDFNNEAFVLSGNSVAVDFQLNGGQTTINKIGSAFVPGLALAINTNASTPLSSVTVSYPLADHTSPVSTTLLAGWSLITYEGVVPGNPATLGTCSPVTVPANGAVTCTGSSVVDMVISAGDGQSAQTWLAPSLGGTDNPTAEGSAGYINTLTVLQPGAAYFVHLASAPKTFTFQ